MEMAIVLGIEEHMNIPHCLEECKPKDAKQKKSKKYFRKMP
jgi:hypothetical protein